MAQLFCTPDQYPAVRSLIQIGLGPGDIPDEVLDMPTYSGAADQYVLTWLNLAEIPVPPAGWQTDPNYAAYQISADYYCAALAAQNYPSLTSERFDDYSYTRVPLDLTKRAQWLLTLAETTLLLATGQTGVALAPTAFTTGQGNYLRNYIPY